MEKLMEMFDKIDARIKEINSILREGQDDTKTRI